MEIQSRDELIMQYYPMVRRVSFRMVRRLPRHVDVEDLVNIGMLGLIDAVDRFEPGRAQSFSAYARIRVQGAIVDEMRKNDWVPRSVRDRAGRLERARQELKLQLNHEPTADQLAERLGITTQRLEELYRTADIRVLVSMEDGGEDEGTIGEILTNEEDVDASMTNRLFEEKIRDVIDTLPERERSIVEMYYYRDLTFKEIARVLGVTESRISQLHSRLKRRLKEAMEDLVAA
ncbi:MAG: FliA/WhiG family RNA polymerase sigma factor [Myxococcota bacterium]|nr:FliA/WhiG family RNA polymerase sigma factor [Myxococcota bacterium]